MNANPIPLAALEPVRPSEGHQFIGSARIHSVSEALGTNETMIRYVVFEPGARSRPHTHPFDQVLHFVLDGIIALDGGEDLNVSAGEVVLLRAGVPHMHGARPGAPSAHVSIMRQIESDFDCPISPAWERFRRA